MARLKKSELIDKMNEMGISFDENLKYEELYKIYNEFDSKNEPSDKVLKEETIREVYSYVPKSGEELIVDRPSTPLNRIRGDKELYMDYINKKVHFTLYMNGEFLYDSKSTSGDFTPRDDHFVLFGRKYPYIGVRIKVN